MESGAAVMIETVAEAIVQDPVSVQQPSPVAESLVVSSPLDIVPVTQDSVTMVSGAANMSVYTVEPLLTNSIQRKPL